MNYINKNVDSLIGKHCPFCGDLYKQMGGIIWCMQDGNHFENRAIFYLDDKFNYIKFYKLVFKNQEVFVHLDLDKTELTFKDISGIINKVIINEIINIEHTLEGISNFFKLAETFL